MESKSIVEVALTWLKNVECDFAITLNAVVCLRAELGRCSQGPCGSYELPAVQAVTSRRFSGMCELVEASTMRQLYHGQSGERLRDTQGRSTPQET